MAAKGKLGRLFSAKGAAFTASLGQRPKVHGSRDASAEARFISDAIETHFERFVTGRFEYLGDAPG
jgi:hypothetical protein